MLLLKKDQMASRFLSVISENPSLPFDSYNIYLANLEVNISSEVPTDVLDELTVMGYQQQLEVLRFLTQVDQSVQLVCKSYEQKRI